MSHTADGREWDGTFNPTMVRLQRIQSTPTCSTLKPFNPTMVRLQHHLHLHNHNNPPPFNPTMVRLQRVFGLTGG